MSKPLAGKVALVTGASRGIGRGVALQLGEAGATVYVTGRRAEQREKYINNILKLQTVDKTADEVTKRGGKGIAVYCDHSNMTDVEKLFVQIQKTHGKLDILVNNAYGAVHASNQNAGKRFWEIDPSMWDTVNVVGLKNHYHCSLHAAKMMTEKKQGLIVTISSAAGCRHLYNTAYATGKAACDKLASDMAQELLSSNVASVGLWPGAVRTEMIQKTLLDKRDLIMQREGPPGEAGKRALEQFEHGESLEFAGRCVVALACDARIMDKSGSVLEVRSLADEYKLKDLDGSVPIGIANASMLKYLATINELRKPLPNM